MSATFSGNDSAYRAKFLHPTCLHDAKIYRANLIGTLFQNIIFNSDFKFPAYVNNTYTGGITSKAWDFYHSKSSHCYLRNAYFINCKYKAGADLSGIPIAIRNTITLIS